MPGTKTEPYPVSWCCVDCLMWLANGETNPEWSESETREFLTRFASGTDGCEVTLGMLASEHDDNCDNVNSDRTRLLGGECDCESKSFSWSPCSVCGSNLGGERHAVTFWI